MRYNKVSTVVSDVIQYPKYQITLSQHTDDNNMRFVAFDFNYKGRKSFITARYEIGTDNYESITMDAGFDRPAGQNNYYYELVRVMSHLRRLFNI